MAQSPDDRRCIFIVGSSRSGTTMMGRILNRHPAVHTFHELHFFEELWSPGSKGSGTSREEALDVAAQLLYRERGGGYLAHGDPSDYRREARAVLDAGPPLDNSTRLDVYRTVLFREAAEHDAPVPCEQTPRNGYYLGEILERFPGAQVLHIVRDPPRRAALSEAKVEAPLSGGVQHPARGGRSGLGQLPPPHDQPALAGLRESRGAVPRPSPRPDRGV